MEDEHSPEHPQHDESPRADSPRADEEAAQVPLHAPDLARWCATLLATSAWQAMGLIPDPATHRVERSLDDARLAIDAAGALLQVLRPRLSEAEQREFDTLLTNLRLNFVEQQAKG
jgi:hypothetical protein